MALHGLSREDRLRLMRFVCSFAWSDLEVQDEERELIGRLVRTLGLPAEEAAQVDKWLEIPPSADELDPQDVPLQHRQLFLDAARLVMSRDGVIAPGEEETFDLLEQLLR